VKSYWTNSVRVARPTAGLSACFSGARCLPQNVPKLDSLDNGASHGLADFSKQGWGGPCRPPGKPHRRLFKLHALDAMLGLKSGATEADLERARKGHVLTEGEWMCSHGR